MAYVSSPPQGHQCRQNDYYYLFFIFLWTTKQKENWDAGFVQSAAVAVQKAWNGALTARIAFYVKLKMDISTPTRQPTIQIFGGTKKKYIAYIFNVYRILEPNSYLRSKMTSLTLFIIALVGLLHVKDNNRRAMSQAAIAQAIYIGYTVYIYCILVAPSF